GASLRPRDHRGRPGRGAGGARRGAPFAAGPGGRPSMSVARYCWAWLAATAVACGVFWGLLVVLGTDPRPGPLFLLVALVMAVLALVNLNVTTDATTWDVHASQATSGPGQDTRLAMYARVLSGHLDPRDPDAQLRDRLAELAA